MPRSTVRSPDVIRQARQLLRQGTVAMDMLDPCIGRSWQRCLALGVLPGGAHEIPRLGQTELKHLRESHDTLLRLSDPLLAGLAGELKDCQLVLTSPDATVLKTCGRRFSLEPRLDIAPGIQLDERWFGTNAPAVAMFERAPVLVRSSEHLLFPDNPVSCVAVPLFDPDEHCLGILDLTFDARHRYPEHYLGRLEQAARALKRDMFMQRHAAHWVLEIQYDVTALDGAGTELLAIDDDGVIRGHARQATTTLDIDIVQGTDIEMLLGQPWARLKRQCRDGAELLAIQSPSGTRMARLRAPHRWRGSQLARSRPAPAGVGVDKGSIRWGLDGLVAGWDPHQAREARRAVRVLKAGLPVLLQGPTGSGKEAVARGLHEETGAQGPFVALNCAAIPESLIEAELFGYAEGAFTGARKGGYRGRLLEANGGTLLLDEIGDMPLSLQARLLRVLQEKVVTPLGEHREVPVTAAIVAASHRHLELEVASGNFREDLFYRLEGVVVELPSLAQQSSLVEQIQALWQRLEHQYQRRVELDTRLLARLADYPWPGNWRELRHCLETALVGLEPDASRLDLEDLSPRWQRKLMDAVAVERPGQEVPVQPVAAPSDLAIREVTLKHMERALSVHDGNMSAAARALGISRSTLYRRLQQMRR